MVECELCHFELNKLKPVGWNKKQNAEAKGETKNENRISGGRILKQFGHFLKNQHLLYLHTLLRCIVGLAVVVVVASNRLGFDNLFRLTHMLRLIRL